jgi:DNA-directed RNA polymerase subunit RPC12/RpoP
MEYNTINCKHCGAPFSVEMTNHVVECDYCGANLRIKPNKKKAPDIVILDTPEADVVPPKAVPRREPPQRSQSTEKKPRGFPWYMLGVIVPFGLGFAILLFCFTTSIFMAMLQPRSRRDPPASPATNARSPEEQTEFAVRNMVRFVESVSERRTDTPDFDYPAKAAERRPDGWNTQLRFERDSAARFTIRSAGPDRAFDTEDDEVKSGTMLNVTDFTENAIPVPDDYQDAIRFRHIPGLLHKSVAIQWLIENPSAAGEMEETDRVMIVSVGLVLIADSDYEDIGTKIQVELANGEELSALATAAESIDPAKTELILSVLKRLVESDLQDDILRFLNHSSETVRMTVDEAVVELAISGEAVFQASFDNIEDDDIEDAKQLLAFQRIANSELTEEQTGRFSVRAEQLIETAYDLRVPYLDWIGSNERATKRNRC